MKIFKITEDIIIQQETVVYACNICNKVYNSAWEAEDCEKDHKCDHKNNKYKAASNGYDIATIYRTCINCGRCTSKELEFHSEEIQKQLEEIWNIIKE